MAIYHLHAKVISRSSGRSATGAAAYRAGTEIVDERTGLVHDYQRKGGVDHTEIIAPANAPAWVHDRNQLWNRVELAEKRKDSQVCREVEIALPKELTALQQQELVRSFTQSQFVDKGMVADVAIHHADSDNPHCHILLATRDISPQGFGPKNRDWNRKELLQQWREAWEQQANKALELAGHEQRIDHRTLEAQGIEAVPQVHLGPKVLGLEERGVRTDMGGKALAIEETNAQIIDLQRYREAIEHERNRAAEASQEYRRPSRADRAIGAGPSGPVGRDAPNTREPEGRDPGAGEAVGPAAASGRGSPGAIRDQGQQGSGNAGGKGQGIDAGGAGLDVAAVPDGDAGRGARSGSYNRVVALAAPAHGGREAAPGARGASGEPVANLNPARSGRAAEADGMARVDRTYLAVRRQLEAMGCEQYEIGVRDQQGRMLTRTWSTDDVLKSVPWLKRENAKGSDIYVRPAGEQSQGLVLADDLNQKSLEAMKQEGFAPAVVVETSQANYQAWVRISPTPLEPALATAASKGIAKWYKADPNSADWRHFGRLSGFTNRKPEHVDEIGRNPWVLCHEASGTVAPRGAELTDKLKQVLREQEAIAERDSRLERAVNASGRACGRDPGLEYQKQLKALTGRYGADMDVSKADYMITRDMAMQGYSADQLTQTLQEHSPELPVRKVGHEADYCRRTVDAVFELPGVRSRLQELKREQEREQDRDGPSLGM